MADTITSLALGVLTGTKNGKLDAQAVTRALGSQVFDEVVIDSQVTPEYSIQPWVPGDPTDPNAPASPLPGILGGYFRPRARLRKNGETVATFAPFGEPNGVWLPPAIGAGSAIVALTALALGNKGVAWKAALVSAGAFGLGFLTRPSSQAVPA